VAPNPRVQRTRSSPSARHSPLTRHPLGGRSALLAAVAVLLLTQTSKADEPVTGLRLSIAGPIEIRTGESVSLTFGVANDGPNEGFYFKRPWKWAVNGMRVVATGPDGVDHESSIMLFCIAAEYACTYFKPLFPGETYSFSEDVRFKIAAGRYELRWVYDPAIWETDEKCSAADVPIWKGHAESPPVVLTVRE